MKNSVISILEELIKIDSINPFKTSIKDNEWVLGGNEIEINEYLQKRLRSNGFKTTRQFVHTDQDGISHYNILGEKGNGSKSILFYAHTDTVTSNPWLSKDQALTPRYEKREVYGKEIDTLVGLGSNDMKAGAAIIADAFKDIDPVDYKIKVVFGVDEEFYSLGSNSLVKSPFMDDVSAIVVPEIGDGPNKFMGASTIGLGRCGRCELQIDIFGTGGHGAISYDPTFINAVYEGSKIVEELEKLRNSYEDSFQFYHGDVNDSEATNLIKGSFFVSRFDGGDATLSIPSHAKIIVDFTLTPNRTIEQSKKMIEDLIDEMYKDGKLRKVDVSGEFRKIEVSYKDRPTPYSNGYLTGEDHPFISYIKNIIDEKVGFINYNMGYSVADENVFKREMRDTPVIVLGPIGWNSHRADEWVGVDSVIKLAEVYKEIGKQFSKYLS